VDADDPQARRRDRRDQPELRRDRSALVAELEVRAQGRRVRRPERRVLDTREVGAGATAEHLVGDRRRDVAVGGATSAAAWTRASSARAVA
jgi:hypothetical protein